MGNSYQSKSDVEAAARRIRDGGRDQEDQRVVNSLKNQTGSNGDAVRDILQGRKQ